MSNSILPSPSNSGSSSRSPDSLTTDSLTTDSLDLGALLRPLLRWWWLLVASALLAGFTSAFFTLQQPPIYRSDVVIMVGTALFDPNPSSGEFSLASQLAAAYADLAVRSGVREATMQALGLARLPDYSARHVPNTQLLEIAVFDIVPERAQMVAEELAKQLISQSPAPGNQQDRQQFIEDQLVQLEQGIVNTKAEIERLELELAGLFSARQIADSRAQIDALDAKLTALQNNYAAMLESSGRQAINTMFVMEHARLPVRPVNSDLPRNVVVAVVLGFALAAASSYLLEFTKSTISTEQDLSHRSGIEVLGTVPSNRAEGQTPDSLSAAAFRQSEVGEAYAMLRLGLLPVLRHRHLRTLVVTCADVDDRRPAITANLCLELARAGLRVILVDADLHRPTQQRLFNLPNHVGLSTALTDPEQPTAPLLQAGPVAGLQVITSGPLPPNATVLMGSHRLQTLLAQLSEQADLVVLDAPPLNAVVDGALVASVVDGVVLTTVIGHTQQQHLVKTVKQLARFDATVLGAVVVGPSKPTPVYGHQVRVKAPEPDLSSPGPVTHLNGDGKRAGVLRFPKSPPHKSSSTP